MTHVRKYCFLASQVHSPGSQLMIQAGEPFKTQLKHFPDSTGCRYHGTLDDGGQTEPKSNGRKRGECQKYQHMAIGLRDPVLKSFVE